jgi:hypothetical protein
MDAVAQILKARSDDVDRGATLRAYDEFDAAVGELRTKYRW